MRAATVSETDGTAIVFFWVVCPVVLYIVLLVKFDPVKVFHHLGRFFTLDLNHKIS